MSRHPAQTSIPTTTSTATVAPSPTPTAKTQAEKTLTLGAVPSTSTAYPFFISLGQVINEAIPEINFVVKDSTGSEAVMNGTINKDYDFGQSLAGLEFAAYSGIAPWETKNSDLRRLFSWSTQILIITVSEASGIRSVVDLNGKNLRVGPTGTFSEVTTKQILGALDVQPKYDLDSLTNVATDLKDGKIDGFVEYVRHDSPDSTIASVQDTTAVRLLSFTPEDIQKVVAKYPSLTTGKIPSGVYKNVGEINSFTVVATVATFKDNLSEDQAYKVVKAVWENKDTLGSAYAPFKGYNLPEETIATSLIPLHAGVCKYFEDLGLTIPDQLGPPEAKP
jgi:hypothetical protein